MEKRTSPVKEEEERDVPAGAGDIEGGEIGKFGHKSRVANRDFAKPTSPAGDQSDSSNEIEEEDNELKSTRAEVGEAREENERLKKVLTRIVKDYQALQMHFFDIVQQQEPAAAASNKTPPDQRANIDNDGVELEPELVSLRLGTSASTSTEVREAKDDQRRASKEDVVAGDDVEGLTLGLDVSKFGTGSVSGVVAAAIEPPPSLSSDNSSEEAKEQEAAAGEPWPPSKAAKNYSRSAEEEVAPQAQVKRARVSVRARCDTPTMNDGCQWRKYGQKVSKGNPCPRAYYRCTVAPLCPVRKQVQRCAEDMSILITTYEGNHNHPLPISATAMASTTSAAACMLTSGSSSSAPRLSGLISSTSSSSSSAYGPPSHFYLQNQFISPSSNSHPTITLDLTNKYSSTSNFAPSAPRYPPAPTTFNFSSPVDSNSMPSHNWTGQPQQQPYNICSTHHMYSSLNQAYWQRAAATSALPPPAPNNNISTDTIARAITSDPSFQSALAAAITSYVGARNTNDANANYVPRYLNRSTSLGSTRQGAGLGLLPPPVAEAPKSASGSPVDDMEQAD